MIIFLFLLLFLDDETDFSIRIYLLDRYRIFSAFFFELKIPSYFYFCIHCYVESTGFKNLPRINKIRGHLPIFKNVKMIN